MQTAPPDPPAGAASSEGEAGRALPLAVTLVSSLPPVKGVSPYTMQLVDALSRRRDVGLEVVSFASIYPSWLYPGGDPEDGSAPPASEGVRVRRLLAWYNPLSWLWAGATLKGTVVHAQWWSYILAPMYMVVLGMARLRGKKVLLTVHNVEPHEKSGKLRRLLNRLVFRFADSYIVHSEQNRESLGRMSPAKGKPVAVVPHGVLGGPGPSMDGAGARAMLGLAADAEVVLAFGNIRPYKGVDVLLRAFRVVADARPRARLLIAGQPWCDWAPYQALIDELGLGGSVVTSLGFVPAEKVEEYFQAADVVALPYTHFDAQSGAAALALPYGKPLVVSDAGGLPELVESGECVVPPGDHDALAHALLRVLGDRGLQQRLGESTARRAAELGWGPIAEKTAEIYRTLAA